MELSVRYYPKLLNSLTLMGQYTEITTIKNNAVSLPFSTAYQQSTSFLQILADLIVQTQTLTANVVSLHLHLSRQTNQTIKTSILSQFHLELLGQEVALLQQVAPQYRVSLAKILQAKYPSFWQTTDLNNPEASMSRLAYETDLLTDRYEQALPASAHQRDQSAALLLIGAHLSALNTYFLALQG